PRFRNKAAAELQRAARMVQLLQDVERLFLGAPRVRRALATVDAGARTLRDIEAGAVPRIQITERYEPVVRFDHRKAADLIVGGELAGRRRVGARGRDAGADPLRDAVDDLFGERHTAVAVEFDIEFHAATLLAVGFG